MMRSLFNVSQEYVAVMEEIERTSDPNKLQRLEEARVRLHGELLDALENQGIQFKDRDHATRIAIRISKGEL